MTRSHPGASHQSPAAAAATSVTRTGKKYQLGIALLCMIGAAGLVGCASSSSATKNSSEKPSKVADLNTQLAIVYLRDGYNELALKKLEKAIAADSNFAPAYSALGLLYNRVGDFDKADKYFRKALRIEPDNSSILNNYGQVLCQHEQYVKGQEMFLKANDNALYHSPEIAFSNAGTCAMAAGDLAAAESHFREALQINPRIAPTLLQMSVISYELDRYLPARAYLQRYLGIARHTPQSLWLGIRIERELGDKDALASYALQLEKGFPDSTEAALLSAGER
jgi:type IV pilus assembly protein PilF